MTVPNSKRVFKTVRKVAGRGGNFRAWDTWNTGDILIAEFKGLGKEDMYGHPSYEMEIVDAQFSKDKEKFKPGTIITLNHNGSVGNGLKNAMPGELYQFEYNGMGVIEKGKWAGKDAHSIDITLVEEEGAEGTDEFSEDEIPEEDDL